MFGCKFKEHVTKILPVCNVISRHGRNINFGTSQDSFGQLGAGKFKEIVQKCGLSASDQFSIHRRYLHTAVLYHRYLLALKQYRCLKFPSRYKATETDSTDDKKLKPALDAMTPNTPPPDSVYIVPGKGPPPVPPIDCCMSGCANCVWIQYAEEMKKYFSQLEGTERAKEAIEKIDNPGLQMFLKLELGFL